MYTTRRLSEGGNQKKRVPKLVMFLYKWIRVEC